MYIFDKHINQFGIVYDGWNIAVKKEISLNKLYNTWNILAFKKDIIIWSFCKKYDKAAGPVLFCLRSQKELTICIF